MNNTQRKLNNLFITVRHNHKIYYPKLSIRSCLVIQQLLGDLAQPLRNITRAETQFFIITLAFEDYQLSEDELYDITDSVDDLPMFILELYSHAGLTIQDEEALPSDNQKETTSSTTDMTFEGYIDDLLIQCMSIGMKEEEFYQSTLSGVKRYVKAYFEGQKNQQQNQALFDYQLAGLIKLAIGGAIDRKVKYPSFKEAYAFLDADDEDSKQVDIEWEEEKSQLRLMEWAEQMNRRFE